MALGAVGFVVPAHAEDPEPAPPPALAADLAVDAPPPVSALDAPADTEGSAVAAIVETDNGLQVVTVDAAPGDAGAVIRDLERDPDVLDAFVDVPATIAATDPLRGQQWNLDELDLGALPGGTEDGHLEIVAVVDTGVRATHPDLAGRVDCAIGADFTLTSLRRTGDGCTDPHGHGTHVAGIVSAVPNNDIGVAGVSAARIMPVRVLDANGQGMTSRINAGIIWAVDHGADVINLSIVSDFTTAYDEAIRYALAHDVVVVAAAGNNRGLGNLPQSPASTAGVIAVAATDDLGLSAPFSYSGPTNVISAPGEDILSTTPDGYAAMTGTSMAAPHVAGVVARYRAIHPGATHSQILAAVESTAIDLETNGQDDDTGAGLLDAYELLTGSAGPPHPLRGQRPTTPRSITVTSGLDALTVHWAPPTWNGGSAITAYELVVAEEVDGELVGVATETVGGSSTQAVLGPDLGLQRGVDYQIAIRAHNAGGAGQSSLPSDTARLPTVPSAPRIGTASAGPGAARVRWTAPARTGGSAITGYVVKAYQGWTKVRQVTVPATARNVRLAGLTNGRAHTFVVQAVNAVGAGAHSKRSVAVTPRQAPSAPWIGRPVPRDDAVRVYWTAPKSNGGAYVSSYVVKIYQGTHGIRSVTVSGKATSALITGLGNRGYYSFTVTAKNAVGLGAPSRRSITVRTT